MDTGIFYLVRCRKGQKYRLRDGVGHGRPMKEVGPDYTAFLYRPMVDELDFDVQEINLKFEKDAKYKAVYRDLQDEAGDWAAKLAEAKEIQASEMSFYGGKYIRSIPEIMKDPDNTAMRDTAKKIASKRAAEAMAVQQMISKGEVDVASLGGESAD